MITPAEGMTSVRPCAATIGFFDGVHRGHRHLIRQVKEVAEAEGLESAVITFGIHPREVLHSDYRPRLLSTSGEKLELLSRTGIDNCVVLPFDAAMAAMSARDFMRDVLCRRLGVKVLITGYDNRFGHNRSEGFDDYVAFGREMGIGVRQADAFLLEGVNVSSSVIRSLLQEGEVEMARRCLGYPYTLSGHVVEGEHVGRGMGFPTANLCPDAAGKLIPAPGVYAVTVALMGGEKGSDGIDVCDGTGARQYRGMMNIGTRPTFDGTRQTLETHILDFSGDVYGMPMAVSFVKRLREERRFRSAGELALQLAEDRKQAELAFD